MTRHVVAFGLCAFLGLAPASAQQGLVTARELYAAAAYEDALAALSGPAPEETLGSADGELLRAFCLLALRRDAEARSSIERFVAQRPVYVPAEDAVSPRVRAVFMEVRRALLPSVARELYLSAKKEYEAGRLPAASASFQELVVVLEDPDVRQDGTLADLRLLAEGFRTVSAAAATGGAREAQDPGGGTPGKVGAAGGPGKALAPVEPPVTPPVVIRQELPPWWGDANVQATGAIDLVIDERGRVESASLRQPIHPLYDPRVLAAARTWTYKPALRGNRPVKAQKTLVVKLNGRR